MSILCSTLFGKRRFSNLDVFNTSKQDKMVHTLVNSIVEVLSTGEESVVVSALLHR